MFAVQDLEHWCARIQGAGAGASFTRTLLGEPKQKAKIYIGLQRCQ